MQATPSVEFILGAAAGSVVRSQVTSAKRLRGLLHEKIMSGQDSSLFFREGASALDATDRAISAAECKWRESFGVNKPVEIEFVDAIEFRIDDAKYNSLHFPAVKPPPRTPMVETHAEFEENWRAITLDLCALWDDLPLFAAGGAVLAALHRWPYVAVPPEVTATYGGGGHSLAAKFASEFTWSAISFEGRRAQSVCAPPRDVPAPEGMLTSMGRAFDYGLGRRVPDHRGVPERENVTEKDAKTDNKKISKDEQRRLGLMAFISARCWSNDRHIVEQFKSDTATIDISIKDGATYIDGKKIVDLTARPNTEPNTDKVVVDATKELKEFQNISCPHCLDIFTAHLLHATRMARRPKTILSVKDRQKIVNWADHYHMDIHPVIKENLAKLYGAVRINAEPRWFLAPLHARMMLNETVVARPVLRERMPEALAKIFPSVLAELCHEYAGVDAENILMPDEARARTLQSFRKTDIDLFLITRDPDESTKTIIKLHDRLRGICSNVEILRTANAVTFIMPPPYRNVQVILRLYHTPQQVLLGFDVDCCAVGVEAGRRAVTLPRGARALATRQNRVDPTRQSTTFEARLLKYARRGFAVAAPGLEGALVAKMVGHAEALVAACNVMAMRRFKSLAGKVIIPLFDTKTTGAIRLVTMLHTIQQNIIKTSPSTSHYGRETLSVRLGFHGTLSDYDTSQNKSAVQNSELGPTASRAFWSHGKNHRSGAKGPGSLDVYGVLFQPTPISFRAEEPHGQDRKTAAPDSKAAAPDSKTQDSKTAAPDSKTQDSKEAAPMFTGSFNPVAADWYHVPATAIGAVAIDALRSQLDAKVEAALKRAADKKAAAAARRAEKAAAAKL